MNNFRCSSEGIIRGSWFKAEVRKGWTDKHLTTKESAIDDAVWLASCRCMGNLCDDKASCPHADKPPQYQVQRYRRTQDDDDHAYEMYKETGTLDLNTVREQLSNYGRFQLKQRPPNWRMCDNPPPLEMESSVPSRKIR